MEEKLLPIGTKVYIRDDSEHFEQGVRNDQKVIGEIIEYLDKSQHIEGYLYRISWDHGWSDNTYRNDDIEPIDQKVNEEEINNELKQLFNKILNN